MKRRTRNESPPQFHFKPRRTVAEVRVDAPEGEWRALVLKGRSKIFVTAPEKGADPGITWELKLIKACDERNASFQGSTITQRSIFYDEADSARRKAANMQLYWLRGLCDACKVEFSEVYPEELNTADDLAPLIDAIEGKRLTIWTVHRKSTTAAGEELINVDIRFTKPRTR